MVASADFSDFLRDQLSPLGPLTLRRMFGKTGVFCEGVMLGMVAENTLYFRLDAHNRDRFKEALALPMLNYEKQGSKIDLSFCRVPDRLMDDRQELLAWAATALAAAHRAAAHRVTAHRLTAKRSLVKTIGPRGLNK